MKVILKNSSLLFAKAKVLSETFQIDFTAGTKANGKINLPSFQDVGTYFKVIISGDTDKFQDESLFLLIGGGQRTDLRLSTGNNIIFADCFTNSIGVATSSNASANGTLDVTVEYAENNISYEDMFSKMILAASVSSQKESGTPPASIGPFSLNEVLPANKWYQFISVIENTPPFQFTLQMLDSEDSAVNGSTIRTTTEYNVVSVGTIRDVAKALINNPLGNDASDISIEIYAYEIKRL